jgi:hypothetical protein
MLKNSGSSMRETGIKTVLRWLERHYRVHNELPNPMIHAGTANVNNNCLYYGQAMKANDRDEFRKAMSVELNAHIY